MPGFTIELLLNSADYFSMGIALIISVVSYLLLAVFLKIIFRPLNIEETNKTPVISLNDILGYNFINVINPDTDQQDDENADAYSENKDDVQSQELLGVTDKTDDEKDEPDEEEKQEDGIYLTQEQVDSIDAVLRIEDDGYNIKLRDDKRWIQSIESEISSTENSELDHLRNIEMLKAIEEDILISTQLNKEEEEKIQKINNIINNETKSPNNQNTQIDDVDF